jgi:uncharacterized protein YacL
VVGSVRPYSLGSCILPSVTLRTFLLGTGLGFLVSWGSLLGVLFFINPRQAGMLGFTLFFLALFLATASTASLVGYGLRRFIAPGQIPAYSVRYSLRQGILLGLLLDGILLLQSLRLMRWWLVLILVIIFISLEFFFLSYDQATASRRRFAKASSPAA